ncbi:MAG: hypothetical protein HUJ26_00525 [Planctomycetaceae bacterium]|nr:hypothetical protein [Planctomycetaceae bacterium]
MQFASVHSQEVSVSESSSSSNPTSKSCSTDGGPPACPVCGAPLMEIKHKQQCTRCRTICETCCEGGRG